jgi:DDE family transposase
VVCWEHATAWWVARIDRAYLSSAWVRARPPTLAIYCKAWPVRNRGGRFPKTAFTLDWEQQSLRCLHQIEIPFTRGATLRFPAPTCAVCPPRERCTTSTLGRSVHIHPDEPLLAEFRARQQTPLGRAKLRERLAVEHTLAHVTSWQSRRARYRGLRKNLFDLRRCAVVHNLHVMARLEALSQAA